jgi:hypothetical protein
MSRPYPEQVADNMLNRHGLAVIWQLHLAAARADRAGQSDAARSIIEVADAAECAWYRRMTADRKPDKKA